MITIKRYLLSLSLVFMATAVPLSAMNEVSEQMTVSQLAVLSCAQSFWNAFSVAKDVTHYSVGFIAPEVRAIPDVINGVIADLTLCNEDALKEHNAVELKINDSFKDGIIGYGVYNALCGMKNRVFDGVGYVHSMAINGAQYTHDAINGALIHMTADGDK